MQIQKKYSCPYIMLPKTSAYVRRYDGETEWMHFYTQNNESLEKYNDIWEKVGASIKKEFDREPA